MRQWFQLFLMPGRPFLPCSREQTLKPFAILQAEGSTSRCRYSGRVQATQQCIPCYVQVCRGRSGLPDQPQSTYSQSQRHPHAFHLCFPLFPVRQPLGVFLLTGKDGGSHRWPIRSLTLGLWRSVYVPFIFRLRWHFYVVAPGDKLHCSVQVLPLLIH